MEDGSIYIRRIMSSGVLVVALISAYAFCGSSYCKTQEQGVKAAVINKSISMNQNVADLIMKEKQSISIRITKHQEWLAKIAAEEAELERKEQERQEAERVEMQRWAEEQEAEAQKAVEEENQTEEAAATYSSGGDDVLTKSKGVNYYNGYKETYYSQRVLPGGGLNIPGRHVASDGTIRDSDGYIVVASSDLAYGTVVQTSLGSGKVYDSGCQSGVIDIYTDW